jgi:hypothetical protein
MSTALYVEYAETIESFGYIPSRELALLCLRPGAQWSIRDGVVADYTDTSDLPEPSDDELVAFIDRMILEKPLYDQYKLNIPHQIMNVDCHGRFTVAVREYTNTIGPNDYLVQLDSSGSALEIQLPDITESVGRVLILKHVKGAHAVIVHSGNPSATIDGDSSVSLQIPYGCLHVVANGVDTWHRIGNI